MSNAANDFELLAAQMADHATSWSLGTCGAIAEFARGPDEPVALLRTDARLSAVTERGGIRIEAREGARLFASETTTRESWNHRIALCLSAGRCAMNRRTVLTQLGADTAALREQDREATLFDLGLDALQVDLCIRVTDPDVAAQLKTHTGQASVSGGQKPFPGARGREQPETRFACDRDRFACKSFERNWDTMVMQ